ncbi:hypothetical protein FNV43_RR19473 [Rhamnella rubrinervis]|uniref:Bifunctional inhibitor/plant lipid transfer protein/seed storage helical domain-containing protein n=1 Tax=Rhamnella rubrinervis TaxID=2594499 RepID=A0A8K0DXV3_9ROSA|nr:hypothetical protein FNV43_RR19473 [Rhamnella rubrinervis]
MKQLSMARSGWFGISMSMGVAILMFCGENMMVRGQVGCRGDMQGLIKQCAVYVQKGTPMGDPSEACCTIVRGVDIPCVCQRLSKEIEPMVDMDKVFHVVNFCGRPLAHGTTCGIKYYYLHH